MIPFINIQDAILVTVNVHPKRTVPNQEQLALAILVKYKGREPPLALFDLIAIERA